MVKKVLFSIAYTILFCLALHATFLVITNMSFIEFLTYLKIEEWEKENIPLIMW